MAEAVTILATLIRSAQFEPPSREIVWPQTGMALYPKNGTPMVVAARSIERGNPKRGWGVATSWICANHLQHANG